MTRIVIKQLIIYEHNLSHISKHNIAETDVLEASNDVCFHKKSYGGRYLVIGKSKSRLIAFVVKRKSANTYYLITARDAGRNERRMLNERRKK